MNDSLIPSRYAKALFKLASERAIEDGLYQAMRHIIAVFESGQGHNFRQTISNPFVPEKQKRELVMAAAGLDNADTSVAQTLNDFLTLVFQNNRIAELRGMVYAYDSIYRAHKHISRVHVTWAAQPTPHAEERLRTLIAQKLQDTKMEYSQSVDPALIGGFKIAIDNEQLDASVENELRQLRQQILSK